MSEQFDLRMRPIEDIRPSINRGDEWEFYLAVDRHGSTYIVYWTGEWVWGQFNAGRSVPEGGLVMAARLPTSKANKAFIERCIAKADARVSEND